MNKFYVYLYKHPVTNIIFYVGKGSGNRAWRHLNPKNRINCHFHYTINKIERELKMLPIVELFKTDLSEDDAYKLEIDLIKKFGRIYYDSNGCLTNVDKGGNGPTLLSRLKISESLKNRNFSKSHCENLSLARANQKIPPTAKVWCIKSPTGEIFNTLNLKEFCTSNNLNYDGIKHNLHGSKPVSRGTAEGWRCISAIPYKLYILPEVS